LIRAFLDRSVFSLWIGQVLSGVGDEVYRVAFTWMCVQEVGKDAGGLASLILLSGMIGLVFSPRFLQGLSDTSALIRLDLYRSFLTLLPVVCAPFPPLRFPALLLSAVTLSGLGAAFEPVLMGFLPKLARDSELLRGANGLMALTGRLSRVIGPALMGVLVGVIPPVHFFSLNGFSFLVSAWSVRRAGLAVPASLLNPPRSPSLREAWKLAAREAKVWRSLWAKVVSGGAWALAYGVGLALLSEELDPGRVETFGSLVAVYGVGNLLGVFFVGSLRRRRPELWVYAGLAWLGVGFMGLGWVESKSAMLFWVLITAFGGPVNDLAFVELTQLHYRPEEIAEVYRLRGLLESGFSLLFLSLSPPAFRAFGSGPVVLFCGGVLLLCAGAVFLRGRADTA
jgi:DHA3 family macrolide efflux protein-like MFS transporter